MNYRLIGAICILASTSSFGFSLVMNQKREEAMLLQLERILDEMLLELPYRLTPLPDLIRHAAASASRPLKGVFDAMAVHLDRQILPDAASCMHAALSDSGLVYCHVKKLMLLLGSSLGRFDLSGQLKGLAGVKEQCARERELLQADCKDRIKCCKVLSICAGVALVILLI